MQTIANNPLLPSEAIVKRKYGYITHVMMLTTEGKASATGALCGEVPTGNPRRAGWYLLLPTTAVTCPKCAAILEARKGAV
ncbi:hypothetical protein [Martelella alba]|uniref:Uncharacterized protein n=1 Tax=Martelella alba TaxID=2590451 RepID=A0ABY2SP91_9HYPH|nr:hypothetical protein [Martelella alba]TKI06424.1 hypothetical protein FCN80_10220 [Martelella alba]